MLKVNVMYPLIKLFHRLCLNRYYLNNLVTLHYFTFFEFIVFLLDYLMIEGPTGNDASLFLS